MFNNRRDVKNILWASEIDTLTMLNVMYKSIIGVVFTPGIFNLRKTRRAVRQTGRIFRSILVYWLHYRSFSRRWAFRSINDRAYFLLALNLRGPPISNRINFYHPLVWSINNQRDYRNRGPSAPSVSLCTIHTYPPAWRARSCFADRCRTVHWLKLQSSGETAESDKKIESLVCPVLLNKLTMVTSGRFDSCKNDL